MLKRIERACWRRRATAMDRLYLHLDTHGLTSVDQLAANLDMNAEYVQDLLDDLHVDAIVGCAGIYYYVSHENYVSIH